jgi:monothiol glutaredoxin
MDEATRQRIESVIKGNDVVLFMKGTPQQPQCGFSAQVVNALETLGASYASVNVLEDGSVRQAIKEYSDWPTIPQLYVRGEFIGGCDIVREMFDSGELEQKLGVTVADVEPPAITITDAAAGAFREALQDDGECVRLEVDARFNHALSIGPRQGKDVAVDVNGLTILLDRASAKRANGVRIDFVQGVQGAAFKIENPNEPPRVKRLNPSQLKAKIDAGARLELIDVRTPQEREIAGIAGSRLLDREGQKHVMALPKDTAIVCFCHHGHRSLQAAELLVEHGFKEVYSLDGGIDAWSLEVDPSVSRY